MKKTFLIFSCLVFLFVTYIFVCSSSCAENQITYVEYCNSTDLKATFKMDFPTLLKKLNSKFRETGYSEYETQADSWIEQDMVTDAGNKFKTYTYINSIAMISLSVDTSTNKVYSCLVAALYKDDYVAEQIKLIYSCAFLATILDTDYNTADKWLGQAVKELSAAANSDGSVDSPVFWNGVVFQVGQFYMISAVDQNSYPELAKLKLNFDLSNGLSEKNNASSNKEEIQNIGSAKTVNENEIYYVERMISDALYGVGIDQKYTGSFGEMLNLIITKVDKEEIKETRQKGLYTYYLKFQFINAYNVYMELKATSRDTLEMLGPEGYGLVSEGELFIYYDSVTDKVLRIESTGDIYSALELACIGKKLLNYYSLSIDTSYERGAYGSKNLKKLYELDSEDASLGDKASESAVIDALQERYSEDKYQVMVADNDDHNRFIALVRDVNTGRTVKIIYVCFDKWGVDYDAITLSVGGFDTKYDVLPGDTADDLINKIRNESYYCWGRPAWVGDPASAKYHEGIEKRARNDWDGAVKAFTEAGNYKDAQLMILVTRYDEGVTKLADGDSDGALQAFEAAGDYSNAKEKRNSLYYEKGLKKKDSKDWESAIAFFEAAGEYKDAKQLILEMYYAEGEEKLQEKDWDRAIKAFEAAGDYNDAAAMINKVKYQKASYLEQIGQQKEAKELFISLGNYEDSYERAYKPYYDLGLNLVERQDWDGAVSAFVEAGDYSDAKSRINAVYYAAGNAKFDINDLDGAVDFYEKAGDYSDAKTMIKAVKYKQAESLAVQGKPKEAKELFLSLGNYRDAIDRAYKVYYDQGISLREIHDWDGALAAFAEAGSYSDTKDQINETNYLHAKSYYDLGDYDSAYKLYEELAGYKDADKLLQTDPNLVAVYIKERTVLKNQYLTVGNVVKFGHYEQDNDKDNGPEEIEWIVLDTRNGRSFLLSKYGLDVKAYNSFEPESGYIRWENCELREWLNNDFLNDAFDANEKSVIILSEVDNSGFSSNYTNTKYNNGNDTLDYIYLLSNHEAADIYFSDRDSSCEPTAVAIYHAGDVVRDWWLRSLGVTPIHVALGNNSKSWTGSWSWDDRNYKEKHVLVRPVLWLDVNALFPELGSDTIANNVGSDELEEKGTTHENEQMTADIPDNSTTQEAIQTVEEQMTAGSIKEESGMATTPTEIPIITTGNNARGQEGAAKILFYVKTAKETRVREAPNKKSNLVKNIQVKQLKVAVLETITGDDAKTWYKIMLDDGSIGYARYDFFGDPIYEDISQSLEKSPTEGSGFSQGVINKELVNVRAGTSTGSERINQFSKGKIVTIVDVIIGDDGNEWCKIDLNGSDFGYVMKQYIDIK